MSALHVQSAYWHSEKCSIGYEYVVTYISIFLKSTLAWYACTTYQLKWTDKKYSGIYFKAGYNMPYIAQCCS